MLQSLVQNEYNVKEVNEEKEVKINLVDEINQPVKTSHCANSQFESKKRRRQNVDSKLWKAFQKCLKLRGLFYGLLAAFLFSFSKTVLKKSPILSGSDHSFIRYSLQLVFLSVIIKCKGFDFLGPKQAHVRKLLSLRGFVGACGMIFLHFALTFIAPSDTVALTHSSVIITSILARIFLKEKFSIAHIFSVFFTICGILLISQPSFLFNRNSTHKDIHSNHIYQHKYSISLNDDELKIIHGWKLNCSLLNAKHLNNFTAIFDKNETTTLVNLIFNKTRILYENSSDSTQSYLNVYLKKYSELKCLTNESNSKLFLWLGLTFALCASLTTGIVHTAIKKLCMKKVHYSITIIYGSYFGVPISFAISLILYLSGFSYRTIKPETSLNVILTQVFFSVISAIVGIFAQICLNLGLKYEDASKIAIIKTTDLIFTFLFQSYLVNIQKDFVSTLGAYLILFGTFLILAYKFMEKKISKINLKKHRNNGAITTHPNMSNDSTCDSKCSSISNFLKAVIFFKF
jgi:drug/metabolite transporter (DMT)-like permease